MLSVIRALVDSVTGVAFSGLAIFAETVPKSM